MVWCCNDLIYQKLSASGNLNSTSGWNSISNQVGRGAHKELRKWTQTKKCPSCWFAWVDQEQRESSRSPIGGAGTEWISQPKLPLEPNRALSCGGRQWLWDKTLHALSWERSYFGLSELQQHGILQISPKIGLGNSRPNADQEPHQWNFRHHVTQCGKGFATGTTMSCTCAIILGTVWTGTRRNSVQTTVQRLRRITGGGVLSQELGYADHGGSVT